MDGVMTDPTRWLPWDEGVVSVPDFSGGSPLGYTVHYWKEQDITSMRTKSAGQFGGQFMLRFIFSLYVTTVEPVTPAVV